MRPVALLTFLSLAALPVVSVAQSPATQDARLEAMDPATRSAISAVVDSARRSGLPGEPLMDKALEGVSKGAAPDRIVIAVRNLARDLGLARRALGRGASEAELVAGVGALRAGANASVLTQLKAARGAQSALLPLAVLSDLVAQGTPVDRAASVVLSLAQSGATEAQYRRAGEGGRGASGSTPAANRPSGNPASTTADAPADPPAAVPPTVTPGTDAPRPGRGRPSTTPQKGRSNGRP